MDAVYFESKAKPVNAAHKKRNFFAPVFSNARKEKAAKPPKIQRKLSGFTICEIPTKLGLVAMKIVEKRAMRGESVNLVISQKNRNRESVEKIKIGRRKA